MLSTQIVFAQLALTAVMVGAGQSTSSQSQQYNLALLHSLLAQAHSAGAPGGAAIPGPASQPARPYLPTPGSLQAGASAKGMSPATRPQLPVSHTSQTAQPGPPAQGMGQGTRPCLPVLGMPGHASQHLQRPELPAPPIPASAPRGVTAEGRCTQPAATLPGVQQDSQHADKSAGLQQDNVHGQHGSKNESQNYAG